MQVIIHGYDPVSEEIITEGELGVDRGRHVGAVERVRGVRVEVRAVVGARLGRVVGHVLTLVWAIDLVGQTDCVFFNCIVDLGLVGEQDVWGQGSSGRVRKQT